MIAGVPSIVLAIFGLLHLRAAASSASSPRAPANGAVTGQSFFVAGIVMALLALPLIVGSTREALAQLPARMREASYALGKTRATTIRRVLLPAIRPGIASGVVLGMGRIIGDTAIITILLGATLKNEAGRQGAADRHAARHRLDADQLRLQQLARRRGQRATEGVRRGVRAVDDRAGAERARDAPHRRHAPSAATRSRIRGLLPAGGAHGAADAAARAADRRWIATPTSLPRVAATNGATTTAATSAPVRVQRAEARRWRTCASGWHRVGVARLRRELGRARRQPAGAPRRGARADRRVGVGQDDAAALAQPSHGDHRRRRRAADASRSTGRRSTSSRSTTCGDASRWSSSSPTRSR